MMRTKCLWILSTKEPEAKQVFKQTANHSISQTKWKSFRIFFIPCLMKSASLRLHQVPAAVQLLPRQPGQHVHRRPEALSRPDRLRGGHLPGGPALPRLPPRPRHLQVRTTELLSQVLLRPGGQRLWRQSNHGSQVLVQGLQADPRISQSAYVCMEHKQLITRSNLIWDPESICYRTRAKWLINESNIYNRIAEKTNRRTFIVQIR